MGIGIDRGSVVDLSEFFTLFSHRPTRTTAGRKAWKQKSKPSLARSLCSLEAQWTQGKPLVQILNGRGSGKTLYKSSDRHSRADGNPEVSWVCQKFRSVGIAHILRHKNTMLGHAQPTLLLFSAISAGSAREKILILSGFLMVVRPPCSLRSLSPLFYRGD